MIPSHKKLWPIDLTQVLTTVEHTHDACPNYSKLVSFRIIVYLYVIDGSRR